MRIANNIPALQATHSANQAGKRIRNASMRLSSGIRLNSSKDDPPGLAISHNMQRQIRGIEMANRNSLDGISLVQTAEGALDAVHAMLQKMRELAVQAANDTLVDFDRERIQDEIDQLKDEINSITRKTEFNGVTIFNTAPRDDGTGTYVNRELTLQIGHARHIEMAVELFEVNTATLYIDTASVTTVPDAVNAISQFDNAINQLSSIRSTYGAYQNRLEYTSANLDTMSENLRTSLSRIFDTDMAREMTYYTKHSVISQAAISILAQANQRPQHILQLL